MRPMLVLALLLVLSGTATAEPKPAQPAKLPPVPPGYVLQTLEPIGGKVPRPKSWFYEGGMTSTGFTYVMAREDMRGGKPYDTGLRIQGLIGIRKGAGMSAQEFAQQYLKKKGTFEVVKTCEPEAAGMFQKQCLETIEPVSGQPGKSFHIVYSMYWSDDLDWVVVLTFGAPAAEWETAKEIYANMQQLVLLDIAHLNRRAAEEKKQGAAKKAR